MLNRIKINCLFIFIALFSTSCAGPKIIGGSAASSSQKQEVSPQNIVVMLPLQGKGELAETSRAIHNGILAAYYSDPAQANISIKVIDTSYGNINVLYQQAVAGGAKVVIGPLTKQEIGSVIDSDRLSVPLIALNTRDDYKYNVQGNLYQFGLIPQDEAIQVAAKMIQEKFKSVAVIAPESAWGDKVITAFESEYRTSEGHIAATLRYRFSENLGDQICNFLAYDPATLCVVQKHKNKKPKDLEEIMRRQDIDAIFLVATTATHARKIVPLLKFYYANDLPIYSISTVYSGTPKPDLDQEINDIYFCDMPWVIKDINSLSPNLQAIYKQIVTTNSWEDSFANYKKSYALGIDAYNLAVGLNGLLSAPKAGIEGASGILYLDEYNHIFRKLQWAKMSEGIVREF